MKSLSLFALLVSTSLSAATLPGFRVELVAQVPGLVTSVVADSHGTLYCTTADGWIHRIEGSVSTPVASLPTRAGGNSGLLGMALLDDDTAVVHYTAWLTEEIIIDDVISLVDLSSGAETILRKFAGDVEVYERGVNTEHHGGNPTVAADGSIFFGIGEYNGFGIAQKAEWNGGKIFRMQRDGTVEQFARGMRNPYDLAWDPELQRLVVSDNGPDSGDELHVIQKNDNCGWPATWGNQLAHEGMVPPDYVFPTTIAPTGLQRLARDANPVLRRGYLLTGFASRTLYYFPDITLRPIPDPHSIAEEIEEYLIDVTQAPDGTVYLAGTNFLGPSRILRLVVPQRGDCNGDGLRDARDISATVREIADGGEHEMTVAQEGEHRGSWGCDANADGMITAADLDALSRLLGRRRSVRAF